MCYSTAVVPYLLGGAAQRTSDGTVLHLLQAGRREVDRLRAHHAADKVTESYFVFSSFRGFVDEFRFQQNEPGRFSG